MAAPGSGATVHDVVVVRHLLINTALLLQMCEEKNSNARLWFFSQITNASLCSCKILPLIATSVGFFFFILLLDQDRSDFFPTAHGFSYLLLFVPP